MIPRHRLAAPVVCIAIILAPTAAAATHAASARPTASTRLCSSASSWKTARTQVGELVRVKGKIVAGRYAGGSTGGPTFLDIGAAYPSPRRLTLLIWRENRRNFPFAPERYLRGRTVCAQGFVSLYRGVPQIEVAVWDRSEMLLSF